MSMLVLRITRGTSGADCAISRQSSHPDDAGYFRSRINAEGGFLRSMSRPTRSSTTISTWYPSEENSRSKVLCKARFSAITRILWTGADSCSVIVMFGVAARLVAAIRSSFFLRTLLFPSTRKLDLTRRHHRVPRRTILPEVRVRRDVDEAFAGPEHTVAKAKTKVATFSIVDIMTLRTSSTWAPRIASETWGALRPNFIWRHAGAGAKRFANGFPGPGQAGHHSANRN